MKYARWAGVGATFAVMTALLAPGCDDGTSTDGSTASTASGATDGVTLTVLSYDRVKEIAPAPAGTGKVFLTVDLEIANGTSKSIFLNPALVSVRTKGGVDYAGTAEGAALVGACDSTASLTPGGTAHCAVAFKVPLETLTTKIVYTDGITGTEYAGDFVIDPCNVCNDTCIATGATCCDPGTNFDSDVENCGECGHACGDVPTAKPPSDPIFVQCLAGKCDVRLQTDVEQNCAEFCAGGGMLCKEAKYACDAAAAYDVACDASEPPPECAGKPFLHLGCHCADP